MKLKRLGLGLFLAVLMCFALTGCGTKTVNLNDYIEVKANGYEGYGSFSAHVDFDQILEDYSDCLTDKNLDTQYFGDKTPAVAAEFAFEYYKPYVLAYETSNTLNNGDKVEFSWNTSEQGIEILKEILKVDFKCSDFDYTVEGLEPLREVNPFEEIDVSVSGISGHQRAYVGTDYMEAVINLDNGTKLKFDLEAEIGPDHTNWENGEKVSLKLDQSDFNAEDLARKYGIIINTFEGEYTVNGLAFYPYDNPQLVFDYLTEDSDSLQNALKTMTNYVQVDNEERKVEYVGSVFYYQNKGNDFECGFGEHNGYNQLMIIFHITNDKVPGWLYSYLAPNNDIIIDYKENEDGAKDMVVMLDTHQPFFDTELFYSKEYYSRYFNHGPHDITFEHNGVLYVGHLTIEDCIEAFEANEQIERDYDHILASESLKGYVTEK